MTIIGWVQRWLGTCAMVALVLLSGCGAVPEGESRDLATVSDQTDMDRRAQVRLELSAAYYSRGQFTTALDEVKQALVFKPEWPEALGLRGLIYTSLEEHRLADDSFKRALQRSPNDPDLMHNYAWSLCQQGLTVRAVEWFEKALAQPRYSGKARSWLSLGVCRSRAGQWREAVEDLRQAFELAPGNGAVGLAYGEALYRTGQAERARFYIDRMLTRAENVTAASLWLAVRIERRLGNAAAVQVLGRRLQGQFPDAREALLFAKGQFDD